MSILANISDLSALRLESTEYFATQYYLNCKAFHTYLASIPEKMIQITSSWSITSISHVFFLKLHQIFKPLHVQDLI